MKHLVHMGYAVVVPVCSSVSDTPGETLVNLELKICDDAYNNGKKIQNHQLSLTLGEFHRFVTNLKHSIDTALTATDNF